MELNDHSGFWDACITYDVSNLMGLKYSQHWVLKPPSVRGVEVAKASAAAKARVWTLGIATRWLLKQGSRTS